MHHIRHIANVEEPTNKNPSFSGGCEGGVYSGNTHERRRGKMRMPIGSSEV